MEKIGEGIEEGSCSQRIAEAIARKRCIADGREYENKTAERKDLAHIAENSCMMCGKMFGFGEARIVPPQRVQEQDPYIKEGLVSRRYICTSCYERTASSTREKLKDSYNRTKSTIKGSLARTLSKEFIARG
ncbi:MAG: hypothetical protein ACP5RF_02190 [Candidatus Micrarchaeia archaeon]